MRQTLESLARAWRRVQAAVRGQARQQEISSLRALVAGRTRELQAMEEHARKLDEALQNLDRWCRSAVYNHDALAVWHKDVSFLDDPHFVQAYRRGIGSGHKVGARFGVPADIHLEWRVLVCCWAAMQARHLPGCFVECGVNTGIFSLAVCHYVDFNSLDKDFYLFDTYRGIPEEHIGKAEKDGGIDHHPALYEECYDLARENFAPFPRARLIRGKVPDTLSTVAIDRVSYLSVDMNVAEPEVAALEFFWDKLVPSGVVILDDYGWLPHALQKKAHDEFATRKGLTVLQLPTGQGLLVKPCP
jgi:hypothetical protein